MEFITLRNSIGCEATFAEYGARWVDLSLPDGKGGVVRPVLGFDTFEGYVKAGEQYHGAMVGRVCGRMAGASFSLGGNIYGLEHNDSYGQPLRNHLHGGVKAFHNRMWHGTRMMAEDGSEAVRFRLSSPDGENGYPGNVEVSVMYVLLKNSHTVRICVDATTDSVTPLNLTNHAFFNLQGHSSKMDASSHKLWLAPCRLVECDSQLIPTGRLLEVDGEYYDFTSAPQTIREAIDDASEQVRMDGGFSLAFGMNEYDGSIKAVASLEDPRSGRRLDVATDQPSIQIYTGYFMDGSDVGHCGSRYFKTAGIAMETQGYPDAMHNENFPSILCWPEKPYRSVTEYRFR